MKIRNPKKKWSAMTERERRASLARTWDDIAKFYVRVYEAWSPFLKWLNQRLENIARHHGVELSHGPICAYVTYNVSLGRTYGGKPLPAKVAKCFDRLAEGLFAQGIFPKRRIDKKTNRVIWEVSPVFDYNPKTGKNEPWSFNPWKEGKKTK